MRNRGRRNGWWVLAAPLGMWLAGCVTPVENDDDDGRGGLNVGEDGGGSCSESDQPRCDDSQTLAVCEDGTWTSQSCSSACNGIGFTGDGCSEGSCRCDEPIDSTCALGAQAFCACAEGVGEPCSSEQLTDFYVDCYRNGSETLACFAEFVSGETVNCAGAAEVCL